MTLRDAIDKEQFFIENIAYSDHDLTAMPLDQLKTLKMQIQKKLDGLDLSLKEKPDDSFGSGRKRAQFINRRVMTYVNYLIEKSPQQKISLADYFFEHAREILPPMLFEQILNEAQMSVKVNK
jgi:hypothetical protein